jgi:hypothetical protein
MDNLPVIENLATKDMSSDAPAVCPPLFPQPIMTQRLRVDIIDLKAAMMRICLGRSLGRTRKECLEISHAVSKSC